MGRTQRLYRKTCRIVVTYRGEEGSSDDNVLTIKGSHHFGRAVGLKARAHAFVEGEVQGVGFRASAWSVAKKLGVTGWVRNVPDGRVETMVEGDKENVEKMVEWCKRGPPGSYVINIRVEWLTYLGEFKDFEIRRAGF